MLALSISFFGLVVVSNQSVERLLILGKLHKYVLKSKRKYTYNWIVFEKKSWIRAEETGRRWELPIYTYSRFISNSFFSKSLRLDRYQHLHTFMFLIYIFIFLLLILCSFKFYVHRHFSLSFSSFEIEKKPVTTTTTETTNNITTQWQTY